MYSLLVIILKLFEYVEQLPTSKITILNEMYVCIVILFTQLLFVTTLTGYYIVKVTFTHLILITLKVPNYFKQLE